jgi:hypothetical protein
MSWETVDLKADVDHSAALAKNGVADECRCRGCRSRAAGLRRWEARVRLRPSTAGPPRLGLLEGEGAAGRAMAGWPAPLLPGGCTVAKIGGDGWRSRHPRMSSRKVLNHVQRVALGVARPPPSATDPKRRHRSLGSSLDRVLARSPAVNVVPIAGAR